MAHDHIEYLAVHVLNERQFVSFRSLSRALKVHSNLAKQMLFDFHSRQNSKKPHSVHATYLITGTKLSQQINGNQTQDGEDSIMQSDPIFPSSSFPGQDVDEVEAVPIKSIMLVKEEHLDQAKASFERITGIHVYSLQAGGLSDVQSLTECNRQIVASYASEDPLIAWKQYGIIQNPNVRRRTAKTAPPPQSASVPTTTIAPTKTKPISTATKPAVLKRDNSDSQPASQESKPESTKPTTSKSSTIKRQASSIAQSFAKASAQPAKPKTKAAATKKESDSQDVPMAGFSSSSEDEESEDESDLPAELQDVHVPTGKSRDERAAELEAMMEQEDETMEDVESGADPTANVDTPDAGEAEAIDTSTSKDDEPQEEPETVTVENGRRRGRRRVMKKRTVKDEEGYLVTKEEAAWESFSEDEPVPKRAKVEVSAAAAAPAASKGGNKKAAKPGQGNIMSFFGKK